MAARRGGTGSTPSPANAGEGVELSIVMPCLDEAETVATCVGKALGFLERTGVVGEVIVADNGSRDGSPELARQAGARVVAVEQRGYGAALSAGVAAAQGRFVVIGDADDSYDFAALDDFLDRLRQGLDLVVGERFSGAAVPGAMPFLHRHVGNPGLSFLGRLFFHSPVHDFHCGLRGFRRRAVLDLDLRTRGMEYASEMIVKATLAGLSIAEVPTTLRPAGRSRDPHLRPWRDGWRHVRFLLLYSPRWLFLYPGLVLAGAGLVVGVALLAGPRTLGGVTFDVATLLYAALAVILGVQAIIFSVLTRSFAAGAGLLPPARGRSWVERRFSLARGLVLAGVCVVAGVAISVLALRFWEARSFGDLDPAQSLRLVVPGVTLTAVGAQIGLASFVLDMFRLERA